MDETTYLLGNPVNAEWLRASIADAEAGNTICVDLDSLRISNTEIERKKHFKKNLSHA